MFEMDITFPSMKKLLTICSLCIVTLGLQACGGMKLTQKIEEPSASSSMSSIPAAASSENSTNSQTSSINPIIAELEELGDFGDEEIFDALDETETTTLETDTDINL
jgi:hypothetical protein